MILQQVQNWIKKKTFLFFCFASTHSRSQLQSHERNVKAQLIAGH